MKNIFIDLNGLIYDTLSPEMMAVPAESLAAQALVTEHIRKLPIALSNAIIETNSKKAVTQLVQKAQLTASLLLARLAEYQAVEPNAFYDSTAQQLTDFILYLRSHYNELFNTKAIMPESIWQLEKQTLERYLAMLDTTLQQNMDPELRDLAKASFEEMLQEGPLTFASADNWNKLLKTLCSTPEAETLILDPQKFSRKRHFMEWIRYYTSAAAEPNGVAEKNKIELGISVAQLGVLLWLLVSSGIIVTNNISELIRIIAAHVRTTKTGSISPDSLQKHFYTRTQPAKSILLSMLRNMMQRLFGMLTLPFALLSDSVAESYLALG
jgi:hypothetical protein